jgi:cytochrome P450
MEKLPVPAGTEILCSIYDFNTCTDIWGDDAAEFKPERFLRDGGPLQPSDVLQGSLSGL